MTPEGQRERPRPAASAEDLSAAVRSRLIESRLTPNAISLVGLVLNLAAAALVWQDYFFLGGVAFIAGSVMDTLDGLTRLVDRSLVIVDRGATINALKGADGVFHFAALWLLAPAAVESGRLDPPLADVIFEVAKV